MHHAGPKAPGANVRNAHDLTAAMLDVAFCKAPVLYVRKRLAVLVVAMSNAGLAAPLD
ncbi:hypothetical protein SAMN04515666_103606 [Bosea lupini]|uniref:Uncharacterized protein n=1 Tax=Bosea lupini TaxID=1036779 RepID=A0A1H7PTM5_9HYPH|nr:hypothetical protein SAMN04515666_103606 [Bosea lupini]